MLVCPWFLEAVRAGEVSNTTIDNHVSNILAAMEVTGALDQKAELPEKAVDNPDHRALIREAGRAGMVLLKNDRAVLPLTLSNVKTIAVIGQNADRVMVQGGGSAFVAPHYEVSPLDAIRKRCGSQVQVTFSRGASTDKGLGKL